MKVIYIWLAFFLLLLSSAGIFYAGYNTFNHPDGSSIGLTLELLKHTPFNNFLIPGILLVLTTGLPSVVTAVLTLMQVKYYQKCIMASGLMLTMWMLVQMAWAPEIKNIQYVVFFTGIAELFCGIALDDSGRTDITNKNE